MKTANPAAINQINLLILAGDVQLARQLGAGITFSREVIRLFNISCSRWGTSWA